VVLVAAGNSKIVGGFLLDPFVGGRLMPIAEKGDMGTRRERSLGLAATVIPRWSASFPNAVYFVDWNSLACTGEPFRTPKHSEFSITSTKLVGRQHKSSTEK
jgi:hypothetical protein